MRTAAAVLLSLLLAIPVLGAVRDEPQPAPLSFARVPDPGPSVGGARYVAERVGPDDARPVVRSVPSHLLGPVAHRPNPVVPSPRLIVVPTSRSDQGQHQSGALVGSASWYCGHGSPCTRGYPRGLYAAAGPALRVGDWRGRTVRVTAGDRHVEVRLIDCNCGPNANLIDLYSDVWDALGVPLSRGVMKVTVSW